MDKERVYLCIDLKSFYASVECVEMGLDPMTADLVVADPERSEKTICLAVSPHLKELGVHNRCRVFEIPRSIKYIMAPPRMSLYIKYSADIYSIYLKYIAKEDIHVYSIDEAFLDVTDYLLTYRMDARELAQTIMKDILDNIGVTATCGIGTNLYLTKIALDITAKHCRDHIGYLDEELYRKTLWHHTPLTDFWRIGPGIAARLARLGICDMEQVAHADESALYHALGVDAALLIDHAWGRESTLIADIKSYRSKSNSMSSGQVIGCECDYNRGLLLVQEMVDLMCLEMVDKGMVTSSISLYIGFSEKDSNGAHGSSQMSVTTNSYQKIAPYFDAIYKRIIPLNASIKRIYVNFNDIIDEVYEQYDLFTDPMKLEKERKIQHAVLDIKKKFGKNAILKGMNLQEGAMTIERNHQIGGHKSGE